MGGFCLLLQRDGAPADRELLAAMAGRLAHRARDGADEWVEGPLAAASQRFWTTPEDVGGRQPLRHPDGRRLLLWDGRLDNRPELIESLAIVPATAAGLSDAALVLHAYERWEDGCWPRLIGPFAAAVCDPRARRVTLIRDPIGDRSVYYHPGAERLIAASEEQAVLAAPEVDRGADLEFMARHLAVAEPTGGRTFFAGVRELLPGHRLTVGPGGVTTERWWQADPVPALRHLRPAECAERFRELLARAVSARLRGTGPLIHQLSGGLDSTSVAALAAAGGARLSALSWVFDEVVECDEREYIEPLLERYPTIEPVHLVCDRAVAFEDLERWPCNPNAPEETPFRPLVEAFYREAEGRGARVMLSGLYGDHLFLGGERWWLDLLGAGEWRAAATEGLSQARELGPARFLKRYAARPLLPRRWRERRAARRTTPWLTPRGRELVAAGEPWPPSAAAAERPHQHRRVLSLLSARATVGEQFHLRSHGIDLRNPYRDRRLIEFMLAVPSFLLEREGRTKEVLRLAMRGLVPDEILDRRGKNSFAGLYRRGMTAERRRRLWARLERHAPWWRELVDRRWLGEVLWDDRDSRHLLVLTRCLFLGHWAERAELAPARSIA